MDQVFLARLLHHVCKALLSTVMVSADVSVRRQIWLLVIWLVGICAESCFRVHMVVLNYRVKPCAYSASAGLTKIVAHYICEGVVGHVHSQR